MRVIAGTARSLPLETLPGDDTRPTTDRIKETLFNMLNPRLGGCRFLDLFSGSGAIAIEALSRGAAHADLVEKNRKAVRVIENNLAFTKLKDKADVYSGDVKLILPGLKGPYDIIFMDPPYRQDLELEILHLIRHYGPALVHEDTLIVVEAALETSPEPMTEAGYELVKYKKYKSNAHIFLRPEAEQWQLQSIQEVSTL